MWSAAKNISIVSKLKIHLLEESSSSSEEVEIMNFFLQSIKESVKQFFSSRNFTQKFSNLEWRSNIGCNWKHLIFNALKIFVLKKNVKNKYKVSVYEV